MVPIGKKPAPGDHESSLKIFMQDVPVPKKQGLAFKIEGPERTKFNPVLASRQNKIILKKYLFTVLFPKN